jgi:hypothetical protein
MNIELRYPVIAFAKRNVVHFARNSDDLTICSSRGLKNGFYNGLEIIDSDGKKYEIENAQKVGTKGFLFGLNILYGQKLRIKLNFSNKIEKENLEELKARINKAFKKDKFFWNSDGSLSEKKSFINNAISFKEIIEYLTGEFYKNHK